MPQFFFSVSFINEELLYSGDKLPLMDKWSVKPWNTKSFFNVRYIKI